MPGVGLYEVGPGKTYATIQAALDQLWADQGAAIFTASQYIRVFASTYVENLAPNAGLLPDMTNGYLLVIEGDPNDDRENIKLDPANGHAIELGCDQIRIKHMWIDVTSASYCLYTSATCYITEVLDCKLTGIASTGMVRAANGVHIEDCEITLSGNGRAYYSARSACTIKSCKITGPGKAASSVSALRVDKYYALSPTIVKDCVISGFEYGIEIFDNAANGVLISNTIFHDCTATIRSDKATLAPQQIVNCIFKDCTYHYQVPTGAWPEETSTRTGPAFIQRNNIYHGYTAMGYDGATTKTYAQWIAYAQVDAAGELDDADPLLINPGAGDFNLQLASPCRGTGYGSGSTSYIDGTPADGNHPNIGATGSADDPPAPIWGSGVSNIVATDAVQNDRVSVIFDAAPIGGSGLSVEYAVQYRIGTGSWTVGWIGEDLGVSIADLVQDQEYEFRVGARCADYEQDWVYPSDTDTATPTGAAEPAKPTIANAVDDKTGTSITLSLIAQNPADVLTIRYRALDIESWTIFGVTRTGSGDLQVTGLNPSKWTFIATAARTGDNSLPSDPAVKWATTGIPSTGPDSLSTLRSTPHTVLVIKPSKVSDGDTNVGTYDYDNPISTRSIKGLLQITGGSVAVGSEGQVYNYDAMFYTHDNVISRNDRIEVALDWLTDTFLVLATQPKGKLRGRFDHTAVVLQRDVKR